MIYLSTGGFSLLMVMRLQIYLQKNITNIELSGGTQDVEQLENLSLNSNCNFQIHNYFPPPQEPLYLIWQAKMN